MNIELEEVLSHEAFRRAGPVIRAGAAFVPGRQVRWVHSSEVMDIAPLLSGGELLLTGGVELAAASAKQRRQYIRDLAARSIAALGIESGGPLKTIPADLIQTAEAYELPLIELRKVAPFVQIAQSINSLLVTRSVDLLRQADVLSQNLAAELANGGGLKELLQLLARQIPADVTVLDGAGTVIEQAMAPAAAETRSEGDLPPLEFDISQRGTVTASLRLCPKRDGDSSWAQVVGDRAASILALALHGRHAPDLVDVAGKELVRSILGGVQGQRLRQLCRTAGMDPDDQFVVVLGRPLGAGCRWAGVERLVRKHQTKAIVYVQQQEMVAVAALPAKRSRARRATLLSELKAGVVDQPQVLVVGPVSAGIADAARSLAETRLTFDLAPAGTGPGSVIDADAFVIERLASQASGDEAIHHVVDELLGGLIAHDDARRSRLLETLDEWLASGCNTAETARVMHLERQSLYNRLEKIFELIGGDPRGTDRLAGLHLAARLGRYLRSS
ncbi:PucR family transcriptional regulator [Crystallibacter degradans]|uniref:PucR family transcriptional regulator n=1 Tax=Crystallibacter degradans TaxID=2726743 RepID=UPI001474C5FD|nr:PucR family transcriptional regulator [Arthrobacter sp. SF27]NMR31511.1 PucR family transcriptional regulator [Arthrobacter sp. SF27]